jgi:hypothetical protein
MDLLFRCEVMNVYRLVLVVTVQPESKGALCGKGELS